MYPSGGARAGLTTLVERVRREAAREIKPPVPKPPRQSDIDKLIPREPDDIDRVTAEAYGWAASGSIERERRPGLRALAEAEGRAGASLYPTIDVSQDLGTYRRDQISGRMVPQQLSTNPLAEGPTVWDAYPQAEAPMDTPGGALREIVDHAREVDLNAARVIASPLTGYKSPYAEQQYAQAAGRVNEIMERMALRPDLAPVLAPELALARAEADRWYPYGEGHLLGGRSRQAVITRGFLEEAARPTSLAAMAAPPLRLGGVGRTAAANAALQGGLNVAQDVALGRTEPESLALSAGLGVAFGAALSPGALDALRQSARRGGAQGVEAARTLAQSPEGRRVLAELASERGALELGGEGAEAVGRGADDLGTPTGRSPGEAGEALEGGPVSEATAGEIGAGARSGELFDQPVGEGALTPPRVSDPTFAPLRPGRRAPEAQMLSETGEPIAIEPTAGRITYPGRQPIVQGVSEEIAAPAAQRPRGEDITGAQLERDAQLYERAFGQNEPPDLPAPVAIAKAEQVLPQRQLYLDQVTDMQRQLEAAQSRAKEVRAAYQSQASRRSTVGKARAKGMGEMPQGLVTQNEVRRAEQAVRDARAQVKQAKRLMLEADVRTTIDDFAERAKAAGGDSEAVDVVVKGYEDAVRFASDAQSYIDAPQWRQTLAKFGAFVRGDVPDGIMNAVARSQLVIGNALRRTTDEWLSTKGRDVVKAIERHTDDVEFVGPAKYAALAEEFKLQAIVAHPDWWAKKPPELRVALEELQRFQSSRYAIVTAIDPRAAPALDAPYLRTIWDIPDSELTSAIARPQGRVSVAKKRGWPDPFDAMLSPNWPYKLRPEGVAELVESSAKLADRQVATMVERKLVLQRYGVRGGANRAKGIVAFRNPNYAGWYGPKEVVNFVDQLHDPAHAVVAQTGRIVSPIKNVLYGLADIGVWGQHVLQLTMTRGTAELASAINRALELAHLPHMQLYMNDDLARVLQRELDGVPQGVVGAVAEPRAGTVIQWLPGVGKTLDKPVARSADALQRAQFAGVLTPMRNMAYEGNLMLAKLLRKDIADPAVRRAAAENAMAFSGGSLGALRRSRRQFEQAALGAPQITRSMAAQLDQVAKIATKGPASIEGLLALSTLATFAATVYGMGSAINMAFGSGKPVTLDPRNAEWATVHLGGRWEEVNGEMQYVGGNHYSLIPQKSLIRALGKSMVAVEQIGKGEGDEGSTRLLNAWGQFAFTRSSPAVQAGLTAAFGTGFTSEGYFRPGGLNAAQRGWSVLPTPLTARSAVEGEYTSPTEAGLGILGVGAYPGQTAEELDRAQDTERAKDVREQLKDQKIPTTDRAFASKGWQGLFAEAGFPASAKYEALADFRQAYVEHWLPKRPEGMSEGVARGQLEAAFERIAVVRHLRTSVQRARLEFWRAHPELLDQAIDAGVEDTSDDKLRILREAGLLEAAP